MVMTGMTGGWLMIVLPHKLSHEYPPVSPLENPGPPAVQAMNKAKRQGHGKEGRPPGSSNRCEMKMVSAYTKSIVYMTESAIFSWNCSHIMNQSD